MALDPVLFNVFVLLVSFVLVFKAADLIVYSISRYSRKLGFSDMLAGLVVVALAASMPELISALTGLVLGSTSVLFGTILGTNLVHLSLVLGVLALIGKKVSVECAIFGGKLWALWLFLLAPFGLMLWDNELGRVDGAILVVLFLFYLGWVWTRETRKGLKSVPFALIWKDGVIFVLSLAALLLASRWLVFSAINLSALIGIPVYLISLTVLAVGGALPDFAVALRSMLQQHQGIGIGDILGSVVLELLLFFGIVGIVHPLTINPAELMNAALFLVAALTLVLFFVHRKTMTWKHGILLVALYAAFLAMEIGKAV